MNNDDNTSPNLPSKTQLKREMIALQKLGETLVNLNHKQLKEIPLPELLRSAIETAQTINSHGAKRRQLQYIGKLMRGIDPLPIQQALSKLHDFHQQKTEQFHDLELWRDRLITDGDSAVNEFLQIYASADRQQLRQLLRNAQNEQAKDKPPVASRALFRYLRQVQTAAK